MDEQNAKISHIGVNKEDPLLRDLTLVSIELAEAVRDERLSRISMLRQLRTRFPDHNESELAAIMHQSLEKVVRESL